MEKGPAGKFYSHGKLLLTAEYLVLEGVRALAVPALKGQLLTVEKRDADGPYLEWTGKDESGKTWIEATFDRELKSAGVQDEEQETLGRLLREAANMNPAILKYSGHLRMTTQLEFPRNWGLGSSSTLVSNVAAWAGIDPYELQFRIFGGSGYDIACARHDRPIVYQLTGRQPNVEEVQFAPPFSDQLFFVYLDAKQNSRQEIQRYQLQKSMDTGGIKVVDELTKELIACRTAAQMAVLLEEHERIISRLIARKTIKEERFSDYPGVVKSLGAWGGDFILSVGGIEERNYFLKKGYATIVEFNDMVLTGKG